MGVDRDGQLLMNMVDVLDISSRYNTSIPDGTWDSYK